MISTVRKAALRLLADVAGGSVRRPRPGGGGAGAGIWGVAECLIWGRLLHEIWRSL